MHNGDPYEGMNGTDSALKDQTLSLLSRETKPNIYIYNKYSENAKSCKALVIRYINKLIFFF